MDCIVAIVKYGIFIFNFVLLCLSVFLIASGVSLQTEVEFQNFHEYVSDTSTSSKVLIAFGIVLFVISFFGCWGAFAENTLYLKWYAVLLLMIILLQVVMGMYVFLKRDAIKTNIENIFKNAMEKYDVDKDSKHLVDTFQSEFKCCGVYSRADWTQMKKSIPVSCCPKTDVPVTTCENSKAFSQGCLPKAEDIISATRSKIIWIIASVIGFEAVVIFFTLLVRNSILESRRMLI